METSLSRCIQVAKDAGAPRDQVDRFIKSGYIPLPWQWEFHAAAREADKEGGPVDIGLGGARGPGKSHAVLSQTALDDCQRVPKLKALFLRQTGIAAKESFDDLIDKVVSGHVPFEKTGNMLKFPNGSRVVLGGFQDEDDIDKYIGIEYDIIIVEELNQLTKDKYVKLRGSLRTSKTNWRPRMYTSFNPGGRGHNLVKERYVEPFRDGQEKETRFVGSNYLANPYLNKEYTNYLESLEGDLGKAWREGEWDIFAGQYFSEFRYGIHVVEPFEIPRYWKRIICLDYGYSKPSAVYWLAMDEDGNIFAYRELYCTNKTYEQLMTEICVMTPPQEWDYISYIVADPAIWAKKGETELSGFELMYNKYKEIMGKGVNFIKANNDRVIGWNMVREYLRPIITNGVKAGIQIFSTCVNFIRTFPTLVYDEHKVEDLDSDGEDHAADAIRYGVMSRPPKTPTSKSDSKFLRRISPVPEPQTSYE